jgi:ubiquinone/menaquinone biosynthesis C-methylase UbiE
MDINYARYLLEKTRKDYNLIAEDFSRTRRQMWEELKFLEEYVIDGKKILDLGCGNGRLYELLKDRTIDYYGVDFSEKLIEIARSRYPKARFQVADVLNLPFPNNFFDKIFSIAVFHHIPSRQFRLQFLREAKRVLKPEGKLILVVWNLNTWKKSLLFLKYTIFKIFGKSKLDFGDAFIPWRKEVLRYIHRFSKNELKKLTEKIGFKVKEIKILKRPRTKESNILLVAEK